MFYISHRNGPPGAVATDFDGDGRLELMVSHGESAAQPLSVYKVLQVRVWGMLLRARHENTEVKPSDRHFSSVPLLRAPLTPG